jgi:predicted  nucleic acid-binding Zn-ribbon protein
MLFLYGNHQTMTNTDQKRLDELKLNVRRLIERLANREEELKKLVEQNKSLELQLQTIRFEQESLLRRYENLKVAKALSGEGAGNQAARQKINTIVREIDKCLALLNR